MSCWPSSTPLQAPFKHVKYTLKTVMRTGMTLTQSNGLKNSPVRTQSP